jgi:hypothetical protein
MKVGAYDVACPREHAARKKSQKVGTFFTMDHFCRFIFKNQWGLYGGDLNGFYRSFVNVILKS